MYPIPPRAHPWDDYLLGFFISIQQHQPKSI